MHVVAAAAAEQEKGPVVVVDNYDSFTYNLCQVGASRTLHKVPLCRLNPNP
jgi:anthranilate/para-aminobenzoate synthase component II